MLQTGYGGQLTPEPRRHRQTNFLLQTVVCDRFGDSKKQSGRSVSRLYQTLRSALGGKWRSSVIYDLIAPVVMAAIMLIFAHSSIFERLENLSVDMRFRVRAPQDPLGDPQLLLVKIDESSL